MYVCIQYRYAQYKCTWKKFKYVCMNVSSMKENMVADVVTEYASRVRDHAGEGSQNTISS